jgi:hypothetical protein
MNGRLSLGEFTDTTGSCMIGGPEGHQHLILPLPPFSLPRNHRLPALLESEEPSQLSLTVNIPTFKSLNGDSLGLECPGRQTHFIRDDVAGGR